MSDCMGDCGGTGHELHDNGTLTDRVCLLCRGSGSQVPKPLSTDPAEAAEQIRALAEKMEDGDGHDPYKAGQLARTLHQVVDLLARLAPH